MKRAELKVGRHVRIGGRRGDEAYVLDTGGWSFNRWAPRGSERRHHPDDGGKLVAVARRGRYSWEPATVTLNQIQDWDEFERQEAAAQEHARQARILEEGRRVEKEQLNDSLAERTSQLLGDALGRRVRLTHTGAATLPVEALQALLTIAEESQ